MRNQKKTHEERLRRILKYASHTNQTAMMMPTALRALFAAAAHTHSSMLARHLLLAQRIITLELSSEREESIAPSSTKKPLPTE